jgi:hypothetical protein
MTDSQYRRMFELQPGTIISLADPRIVKRAFRR